jgi:hypothetical protein
MKDLFDPAQAEDIKRCIMRIRSKSERGGNEAVTELARARLIHRTTGANLEVPGRSVRLSALGLRRDPHRSVKQKHHEELEDGDKERPSAFPKIMRKQTDSGIQQLHGAGERT